MGFDKPDLGFVIHFQRPGSVVHYYQQVGRAGRAIDNSYGVLLSGFEDDEIQEHFIESAFPSRQIFEKILRTLEREGSLRFYNLLSKINVRKGMAAKALNLLELDGAIGTVYNRGIYYFRTPNPWIPDDERYQRVTDLRRQELSQMQTYVTHDGCLMEFLCDALDDPHTEPCGRCANCVSRGFSIEVSSELVAIAVKFLKFEELRLFPRKRLHSGIYTDMSRVIPDNRRNQPGRTLC